MGPEDILKFWLDDVGPEGWYKASDTLDETIRARFEPALVGAAELIAIHGPSRSYREALADVLDAHGYANSHGPIGRELPTRGITRVLWDAPGDSVAAAHELDWLGQTYPGCPVLQLVSMPTRPLERGPTHRPEIQTLSQPFPMAALIAKLGAARSPRLRAAA